MRETFRVRCEARNTRSPYFTDGKVYEARQCFEGARVFMVNDDHGHERVISIGEPSPHFEYLPLDFARGRFITVRED